MSGTNWGARWQGGRTYGEDGRTVYVVEKMRHGRRYTTPLDVGSEREALAELARFERDPEGYTPRRLDAPGGRSGGEADQRWRVRRDDRSGRGAQGHADDVALLVGRDDPADGEAAAETRAPGRSGATQDRTGERLSRESQVQIRGAMRSFS